MCVWAQDASLRMIQELQLEHEVQPGAQQRRTGRDVGVPFWPRMLRGSARPRCQASDPWVRPRSFQVSFRFTVQRQEVAYFTKIKY